MLLSKKMPNLQTIELKAFTSSKKSTKMNINGIIPHSRTAKKNYIKRSPFRSSSLSVLYGTPDKPAGYISTLAHEVRNPLCNINLALEMLRSTQLDEEQSGLINIIMRGSGRIKDLINNLLVSDQIKESIAGYYSLHPVLEEVLALARDRILLKNITLYRDYAATEHCVLLNKEKIKIALTNIVINAIDAMPSEGGELRLITKSIGKRCSLEIQDNGKGISKEDLKRIFEPFFTNKEGGMGLGLSATMDILRENKASVDVRSEEGLGTCFILSFCGK